MHQSFIKYLTLYLVILISFFVYVPVAFAKDANVKDCMDGKADCKNLDATKDNNKDKNVSNVDKKSNETETVTESSSASLVVSIFKTIIALFLILFLIYIVLKLLYKRNKSFQSSNILDNLGGISVGPNKSVQVIRIGAKVYLIGVGDNVELLHELDDESVLQELLSENTKTNDQKPFLDSIFQRKNIQDSGKNKSFKTLFSKELDQLQHNRKKMIKQYVEKEIRDE